MDVSAQSRDFANETGGEIRVFFIRHEKNGFKTGVLAAIHEGHLKFVLEIRDRAQSADDCRCFPFRNEIREEAGKTVDFDAGVSAERRL